METFFILRENRIWKKWNISWWKTRSLIGVLYVQFNFPAWNKLSGTDFRIKFFPDRKFQVDIQLLFMVPRIFELRTPTLKSTIDGERVKSEKSHCMSKQHCEKLLKQQGVDLQAQIHPKRKVSFWFSLIISIIQSDFDLIIYWWWEILGPEWGCPRMVRRSLLMMWLIICSVFFHFLKMEKNMEIAFTWR